mmetsp:Transcript_9339/g.8783  ORF Transcript_9339/g.8783 Transcript_9339/m.8783 type:complete len:97 (+) Transcript_9339:140-430(+)
MMNNQDSRSLLMNTHLSQMPNFSGFIKHSKYLQMYENFRRAFMSLCKLKELQCAYGFRKIKKAASEAKEKKELLQGMARYQLMILNNILKSHVTLS